MWLLNYSVFQIGDIVNDAPLSSGDQENPNMSVPENVISKLLNMDNVNNVRAWFTVIS